MMFNQYPYINVNDLNLDYILSQIKTMMNEVTNFVSINAIKYADPIQWDITRQYEKNTVVIDPVTGTAYISVAPVPAGVALTRPEYWTVVFDLGSFVTRAAQNFTSHYEESTTLTATFPTSMGGWLVWGDVLYKALTNITAGDSYVEGGNIEHFTIEDLYNEYLNTIAQILAMIGDLADLTTSDSSSIVNAINSVLSDVNLTIGDLATLLTTDKSSVVNAINDVVGLIGTESTDRANADNALANSILQILTDITTNLETGDDYTKAYSAGELFTKNGVLYQLTIDVSIGDPIQIGANCAATTIENLINSLVSVDYKTITNSSGAINHLFEVAKTYLENSSLFDYGNYNTLFSTNCIQVGGKWVIDCSSFVEACLRGITFDNSRYNSNTDNIIGSGYYFENEIVSAPDVIPYRPYGMVSSAMYHYCELHGYNYEIDGDINKINVGDLVFLANNPLQYKDIGHVGIVINIRKNHNSIVLLDASDDRTPVIATTVISLDAGTNALYAARIPLQSMPFEYNNILNNGYNTYTSFTYNWNTGNAGANENLMLRTTDNLKENHIYSFIMVLNAPMPTDTEFAIMALVNGTFTYLAGARFDTYNGGHIVKGSFLTPKDFTSSPVDNIYTIRLRCLRDGSTASARSETISIKWYGLFDGLVNLPINAPNMPAYGDVMRYSTPYETETIVASLADLTSALQGFAAMNRNWSISYHNIRTSAAIATGGITIPAGRYLVMLNTYNNGNFGMAMLYCISNSKSIIYARIGSGLLTYSEVALND